MKFDECLLEIRRDSGGLQHITFRENPCQQGTVLGQLGHGSGFLDEWDYGQGTLFCIYVRVPGKNPEWII